MRALDGADDGHLPLLPAGLGRGLLHLPVARSIVITVAQAPAPALARAAEVAEVSSPGSATSTWRPPWTRSGARLPHGAGRGRATLNGQLAAAGLLEVLCLTFPSLVGADAKRILAGVALAEPAAQLSHEQDRFLFLRHRTT